MAAALALAAVAQVAAGDTVTISGKPPFRNVRITDYRDGRLVFRGVSRETLRIPIEQVRSFEIDHFESLNAAEQSAAAGEWAEAARHYEQALREAGERWRGDLIGMRLLRACDRAGMFDRAVELFVELVDAKGAAAAVSPPTQTGPRGSAENRAARSRLERAIGATRSAAAREVFRKLLFELLIADDADDFDRLFAPPAGDDDDGDGKAAAFAPGDRNLVRPAVLNALAAGEAKRAVRMVRRILPHVDQNRRDPWRLLLGRAQVESGAAVAAIVDLMHLAQNAADPGLAVEALYYAGLAHERIDRPDVAEELYREVLGKDAAGAEARLLAGKGLERLKK
jgi:tetratricopeptide (TPR) repeat protein